METETRGEVARDSPRWSSSHCVFLSLPRVEVPDPAVGRGRKPLPFHWIFMLLGQLSLGQCSPGSKAVVKGVPRKNNTGGAEGADVHYLYWQKLKNNLAPSPCKSTVIIKTQQIYCLDSFWYLSNYSCMAQDGMAWFTGVVWKGTAAIPSQENRGSFVPAVIGPAVVGEPG